MRPCKAALVTGLGESREHLGQCRRERAGDLLGLRPDQPLKLGECGERRGGGVGLGCRQQRVDAREVASFDELLGEIDPDSRSQRIRG